MVSAIQLSGICDLLQLCVAGHLVDTRATPDLCTLRAALLQVEMSTDGRWTPCALLYMWGVIVKRSVGAGDAWVGRSVDHR